MRTNGERTTEVKRVDITPQSQTVDDMKFDVAFSDFDGSNNWTHYLTANVTPSDPDAKYVFVYIPADNKSVDLSKTDEELMKGYADLQGDSQLRGSAGRMAGAASGHARQDNDL